MALIREHIFDHANHGICVRDVEDMQAAVKLQEFGVVVNFERAPIG